MSPKGTKTICNLSRICQEQRDRKWPREGPLAPVQPEPPHSEPAPAQPHVPKSKGVEPSWCSPSPGCSTSVCVLAYSWCWVMLQVWLICYFCRFYYNSSKKQQLTESGSSNANSKARQRSWGLLLFQGFLNWLFCSKLMSLVFSQIALILDL